MTQGPLPSHEDLLSDACSQAIQRYQKADVELLRLEDQLDFLIHCSRVVYDQKMELVQSYAESLDHEKTSEVITHATKAYLQLIKKGKALDNELAIIKEKCTDARNACSWLYVDLKRFPSLQNKEVRENVSFFRIRNLDRDGVVDKQAAVKKFYDTAHMAVNVGATVGGLGAGVTFATIFSATRGRLDLMAWAFTCFLSVVFCCAICQTSARSLLRIMTAVLTYFPICHARRWFYYPLWVAIVFPLAVGLGLLGLGIAFIENSPDSTVSSSRIATSSAGYAMLGWIAALLYSMGVRPGKLASIFSRTRHPVPSPAERTVSQGMVTEYLQPYPSHIIPPESKWEFLPGGPEYSVYRKWRRTHNWRAPS